MHLIDLADPKSWPPNLIQVLQQHEALFQAWSTGSSRPSGAAFDAAHADVRAELDTCETIGWHCTRLTQDEIDDILANGMQLPSPNFLNQRIDKLVSAGQLPIAIGTTLKSANQAGDSNRAGKLWFCFFPPREAGEGGIHRFFRHWGGEALYNSHEINSATSPVLKTLGTPCVVEAKVPIRGLAKYSYVTQRVIERFLWSQGHIKSEPEVPEGYSENALLAEKNQHVIKHPEPEFMLLTGCSDWRIGLLAADESFAPIGTDRDIV